MYLILKNILKCALILRFCNVIRNGLECGNVKLNYKVRLRLDSELFFIKVSFQDSNILLMSQLSLATFRAISEPLVMARSSSIWCNSAEKPRA